MPRTKKTETKSSENYTSNVLKDSKGEPKVLEPVKQDVQKIKIKNIIKGVYDIQKLRIATGNRIVQSFNIQMGQTPSSKQEDMDDDAQKVIVSLRKEYQRITDAYVNKSYIISVCDNGDIHEKGIKIGVNSGIVKVIDTMNQDKRTGIKFIRNKLDYELIGTYVSLLDTENNMIKILQKEVEKHPLWDDFFKDVKGCGPLMAAVCISYFDIHKARHVASFWKYAGVDTVYVTKEKEVDGEVQQYQIREGRQARHTETYEYVNRDGEIATKRGLTYNPELKTKLLGVLGSSFLKRPGSYYEQIYRDYRFRLDNRSDLKDYSAGHKHAMANRYMVKQFIRDLWVHWRYLEGYTLTEPYEVKILGNAPHKYNEFHERMALKSKE